MENVDCVSTFSTLHCVPSSVIVTTAELITNIDAAELVVVAPVSFVITNEKVFIVLLFDTLWMGRGEILVSFSGLQAAINLDPAITDIYLVAVAK